MLDPCPARCLDVRAFFLRGQQRFFISKTFLVQKLGEVRWVGCHTMFRLKSGGEIQHGDIRLGLHLLDQDPAPAAKFAGPFRAALPGGFDRTGGRITGLYPDRRRGGHLELRRLLTARLPRRNATNHPKTKIIRNSFSRGHLLPQGITYDSTFPPDALGGFACDGGVMTGGFCLGRLAIS